MVRQKFTTEELFAQENPFIERKIVLEIMLRWPDLVTRVRKMCKVSKLNLLNWPFLSAP